MIKSEKVQLVESIASELKEAKGVVLVNFAGMGVKAQQDLKKRLKEAGAKMIVIKNTLLKLAIESAKLDSSLSTEDILSGQTAVIVSNEDAVSPISVIGKFAKEFEIPQMKIGIIEGSIQDKEALTKIASLPGKDALLGQVLGSLMGNLYSLVSTLQNPMSSLVYTLKTKAG